MLVVVLVVAQLVQNMAWERLVQWVVKDMIVMHGIVMVMIKGFGNFEKNIACFATPLVATQS